MFRMCSANRTQAALQRTGLGQVSEDIQCEGMKVLLVNPPSREISITGTPGSTLGTFDLGLRTREHNHGG